MNKITHALGGALVLALAAGTANAQFLGLNLEGSFAEGGFDRSRYVPPSSMVVLNETPFITTEVKPIYVYHDIPDDFVTQGGRVHALAAQARIALTDRLGFIATTDGWSDINFNAVLSNESGFHDITAGLKYAVISDPQNGQIVTVGIRYTAPFGSHETDLGGFEIELDGFGSGYVDMFISGAKQWEGGTQLQGTLGVNIALADDNWSYVHAHGHLSTEILPGLFPLVEANAIIPIKGGDRLPGFTLTGTDLFDIGASDPEPLLTLGIGARYRLFEHAILGLSVSGNVLDRTSSVHGYRVNTDLTIHF